MDDTAVTLKNLDFSYGDNFSLQGISGAVPRGSFSFLLGPNGAGKTTLFKLASGGVSLQQGAVFLFDSDIHDLSPEMIARTVAVVEQNPAYAFPYTVEEIILMGRFPHNSGSFFESPADIEKAEWAMRLCDVSRFRDRPILSLSGGEKRRVEIARAVAQEAPVLLLDDPSSHLDIRQQKQLFEVLALLNRDYGTTLWIISHHIEFVREYATDLFFLGRGELKKIRDRETFLRYETLITMY